MNRRLGEMCVCGEFTSSVIPDWGFNNCPQLQLGATNNEPSLK